MHEIANALLISLCVCVLFSFIFDGRFVRVIPPTEVLLSGRMKPLPKCISIDWHPIWACKWCGVPMTANATTHVNFWRRNTREQKMMRNFSTPCLVQARLNATLAIVKSKRRDPGTNVWWCSGRACYRTAWDTAKVEAQIIFYIIHQNQMRKNINEPKKRGKSERRDESHTWHVHSAMMNHFNFISCSCVLLLQEIIFFFDWVCRCRISGAEK